MAKKLQLARVRHHQLGLDPRQGTTTPKLRAMPKSTFENEPEHTDLGTGFIRHSHHFATEEFA